MMTWTMTMWTKQMMSPDSADVDKQRGMDYADGGVSDLNVYYPSADKVQACHDEWNSAEGAPAYQEP